MRQQDEDKQGSDRKQGNESQGDKVEVAGGWDELEED